MRTAIGPRVVEIASGISLVIGASPAGTEARPLPHRKSRARFSQAQNGGFRPKSRGAP